MIDFNKFQKIINKNDRLVHRGRFVSTKFLLALGDNHYLVHIHNGQIEKIETGPFVMPCWTFALRALPQDWEEFWRPIPAPGFNDLLALVRHRRLLIEGDQHSFMSNLIYFKGVLESMRQVDNL